MKIVMFVHRFWPSVGGVEKYIEQLSYSLIKLGHSVHVVAGATEEGQPVQEMRNGIEIFRFPAYRSPIRCRWWFVRNQHLFGDADVISVSNTHMLEYFTRMLGLVVSRRKIFLIRHGMAFIHPVPESHIVRARRSLKAVAGVSHDGEFIEKWLGVPPDICPNQGIFPAAGDLSQCPEPESNTAVYVGRLEPDSGISIYIDAVHQLVTKYKRPFHLDVYGDGSLRKSLAAHVKALDIPVTFHGKTANAQVRFNDACFAFVDGRMAIQEAMARRRLVCAAYFDPLKRDYVCTEPFSPYLLATDSAGGIAQIVEEMITHPLKRKKLVDRAFEYASTLTWKTTAQAYLGMWESKLAKAALRTGWLRQKGLNVGKTLDRSRVQA